MTGEPFNTDRISLGSLRRYLTAHHWRRSTLRSGLELFTFQEDEDFEIALPTEAKGRDLDLLLQQAIRTLSGLSKTVPNDVIAAIRSISYDLVHSRLPDGIIRHDTIPLATAEEVIRRMGKILGASAQAELNPQPYFISTDSAASAYIDTCRFGHTFKGSFGFTIESYVGPNSDGVVDADVPAPPLARRAVQRFARGLRTVEQAVASENPDQIVRSYDTAFNANACEELIHLLEAPEVGEVSFDVVFSPEWGAPPDLGTTPSITLRSALAIDVMKEASRLLRHVNYEKRCTIVGIVRHLSSDENPSDLFSGSGSRDVQILWDSPEHGRTKVHVSLASEDYLQAIDAHKAGKMVAVYGELERLRSYWKLQNPRDFTVLDTPPAA